MAIHPKVVKIFHTKTHEDREKFGITKVIQIHPLGTMNIYTKSGNQTKDCSDMSDWTKKMGKS